MSSLSVSDWFGLMSFLAAILSLFFNYVQWNSHKKLEKESKIRLRAGFNAGYQSLYRIAEICDEIRAIGDNKAPLAQNTETEAGKTQEILMSKVYEITGNADSGRSIMNSISRDFINEELFYEMSWETQRRALMKRTNIAQKESKLTTHG